MSAAGKGENHLVFLGLGSNIQPEENLPRAIDLLRQVVQVEALSSVWETPPVGSSGPDFLNAAARVQTRLSQVDLQIRILKPIEEGLGRVRSADPNAPRPIDLDILIFDGILVEEKLWEQAHVCVPLAEIVSGYTHPISGETLGAAAQRLARLTTLRRRDDFWGTKRK